MPNLPFPKSSTPGVLPGEGEGRLINAYTTKMGGQDVIRRIPGLTSVGTAGANGCRGMMYLNALDVGIYGAWSGAAYRISGGSPVLLGTLPGTGFVTWARNNRTTAGVASPDLIACRAEGGAYVV